MKKLPLLCITVCCSLQMFAQQRPLDKNSYEIKLQSAMKTRNVGIVLTSVGCGVFATGLIASSDPSTYIVLDATLLLAGAGLLGTGIPLWVVGEHQKHKLKKSQGLSLSLTPNVNGITLRLRF